MKKRTGTESALDAALDALLAGDKQSLLKAIRIVENHPQAGELQHLLTSAIETREAIRATPSDQARVRHLRMIGLACREQDRARASRRARDAKRMRHLVLRPLAIAGASLGLLVPGALALASTAQPGDPLYGTKLTVEQVQLALTTSPEAEIALHLKFAERRMDEVQRLEQGGGDVGPEVTTAASNLQSHSVAVKDAVAAITDPPATLTEALERHRDGINELAGRTGCDRSRSSAGCQELQTALASSVSALEQLKEETRPGGAAQTLAGKAPDASGAPARGKPKTGRSPSKPSDKPETAPASPTTPPSETAAPAGGTDPSESPSPAPSPSPSPSPSPQPSTSPSQDPAPVGDPAPAVSPESPGAPANPVDASPNGADTIEPHATGEVPTSPIP